MMKTLALSAVAAMGMMLLPVQTTSLAAAPALGHQIATPDSAIVQVRRGGGLYGRSYGGRSYGGRSYGGRSFGRSYGGRSYGRAYRGGRHVYGGRHYGPRHHRRGYIYGAGIPFFYGGYDYYGGCDYYYRKWRYTGSHYWRNRYYSCRW